MVLWRCGTALGVRGRGVQAMARRRHEWRCFFSRPERVNISALQCEPKYPLVCRCDFVFSGTISRPLRIRPFGGGLGRPAES